MDGVALLKAIKAARRYQESLVKPWRSWRPWRR